MTSRACSMMLAACLAVAAGTARADMERKSRQQAMHAIVWIGDVQCSQGGECDVVASGSGTVLTADGVILTNNHVVQDVDDDGQPLFSMLRVGILRRFDEPPETVCIAYPQHAIRSKSLDLAIIKCEVDTDMRPLQPGSLVFPTVKVGDSKSVAPGDDVAVIGYPGVGGGTITYTTGKISGFTSDEDLQDEGVQEDSGEKRDWIKTDAKIAPGNSGGGAFDDSGALIGVPSANWTQPQEGVQFTMGLIRPIERAKEILALASSFDPTRVTDSGDENWRSGGHAQPASSAAVAGQGSSPAQSSVASARVGGGVHVVGQLVAADSGDPIEGGMVLVLKAGVKVAQVTVDNVNRLYLTKADSDSTGNFALEDEVPPGSYGLLVVPPQGYDQLALDDVVRIDKKTRDIYDLGKIEVNVSTDR